MHICCWWDIPVSVARDEQFEFAVRPLFGGVTLVFQWVPLKYIYQNVISGALE